MWKIFKTLPKTWRHTVCSPLGTSQCTDGPTCEITNGDLFGTVEVPLDPNPVVQSQHCSRDTKEEEVGPTLPRCKATGSIHFECPARKFLSGTVRPSYDWFRDWFAKHRDSTVEQYGIHRPRLFDVLGVVSSTSSKALGAGWEGKSGLSPDGSLTVPFQGMVLLMKRKYELLGRFISCGTVRSRDLEEQSAPTWRLFARSESRQGLAPLKRAVLPPTTAAILIQNQIPGAVQDATSGSSAKKEPSAPEVAVSRLEQVGTEYAARVLNTEGKTAAQRSDFLRAAKLFSDADNLGLAEAKYNLGVCYESGLGVERNMTTAAEYYDEASEFGHGGAAYNLAVFHLENRLAEVDHDRALELMVQASQAGVREAQTFLGVHHGQRGEFDKAAELLRKAADQKDANGQYYLGICYENGLGVKESAVAAARLYEEASKGGNSDASYRLATFLDTGVQGIPEDGSRALELFHVAASKGHQLAIERLNWEETEDSETEESSSEEDNSVVFESSRPASPALFQDRPDTPLSFQHRPDTALSFQHRPDTPLSYQDRPDTPPSFQDLSRIPDRSLKFDFSLLKELTKYFTAEVGPAKALQVPGKDDTEPGYPFPNSGDHGASLLPWNGHQPLALV